MGRCELDGVPLLYVVMELADENLSEILPHRALSAEETREMLPPVLDALAYVHEKGFAHAAIKPANIMAVGDRLKISSDRLVTIGERNFAAAPTAYDPPEIARGVITPAGAMSPAGDVWSLGMTLVEVLTQSIPAQEWGSAEGPPLPSDLPQPFLDIARHSLRREVKRRWTLAQIAARMQHPPRRTRRRKRSSLAGGRIAEEPQEWSLRPTCDCSRTTDGDLLWPAAPPSWHSGRAHDGRHANPLAGAAGLASPIGISRRPWSAATAPASASVPQQNPSEPNASSQGDTSGPDAVVKRVLPEVSPSARDTIQGTVRVAILVSVDSSGNVVASTFDFRGPSGYFADRAMQAARQWKFAPAKAAAGNVPGEWLLRFEITRTTINAFADPSNR